MLICCAKAMLINARGAKMAMGVNAVRAAAAERLPRRRRINDSCNG
jgi:hypothetical protein